MKKRLVLILTAAILTFSVAACGKDDATNDTNDTSTVETGTENDTETTPATDDAADTEPAGDDAATGDVTVNSAVDVLANVWATYGEDEMFFAMGGDMNNPVDNAPGLYSMDDAEMLSFSLYIPADSIALVDEAASLVHAMNANTFTGASFHLIDSANAEALTTALRDNIQNTQWMCGFPDKLVIFTVNDEYVISAFGNLEIIDNFKNKVTEVYGENAELVIEENIA